jgi:hypothetical protein
MKERRTLAAHTLVVMVAARRGEKPSPDEIFYRNRSRNGVEAVATNFYYSKNYYMEEITNFSISLSVTI